MHELAVVVAIGIFLSLTVKDDHTSKTVLATFGYLSASAIWEGGYWSLVTSAFVHFEIWHVGFNLYWIWVLGRRLEEAIGSLPYLAFVVISAFLSSAFQLAVSDTAGIGLSGVVYALFGFMWLSRHRYPSVTEVLDERMAKFFMIWLVGCIVATQLNIWHVANTAHISGLLFGAAVAGAFVLRIKPPLASIGLAALIALSIVPRRI